MKKVIFIIFLSFASRSFGMICSDDNGKVANTIEIDDVILVPESAAIGDVIWSSPLITTMVTCDSSVSENVFIYPFPTFNKNTLPSGLSLELVVNDEKILDKQTLNPESEWLLGPSKRKHRGKVVSRLMIKKTAKNIENKDLGDIPLYQVDGKGGLNGTKSLRVSLANLKSIVGVSCQSTISTISNNSLININDDLMIRGSKTAVIANLALSCTPVDSVKNKTVTISVLPSGTYNNAGGLFKTNREGLVFNLMVGDSLIKADTSDNKITMRLDSSGKGVLPVYQNLSLTNSSSAWLFDNSVTTASSNSVKLNTIVKSFD